MGGATASDLDPTLGRQRRIGIRRSVCALTVLVFAYYTTALIGLTFAISPGNATVVWPPSGIALGALLIYRYRLWPGIWTAAFFVNRATGLALGTSIGIATGNTLEALIALWLCRRFLHHDVPFRTVGCAFRFVLMGAIACSVAASIGVGCLMLSGDIEPTQFLSNWSTWCLGDLAAIMLITPVFLARPGAKKLLSENRVAAVPALALVALISQVIFGGWLPTGLSEGLLYFPLIAVFWLLLRFDSVIVFIGNLIIATIAVLGASRGVGPFAITTVAESLFDLQLFMTVYALAALALTGTLTSQRETEKREAQLAERVRMSEKLRSKEAELAHVSRLSAMGEVVAGIAHEINQPLYAIANFAAAGERLLEGSDERDSKLRSLNSQIKEQGVRAGDIIRRLRDFIGSNDGNRAVFSVGDVVKEACQLLAFDAEEKKVVVRIEGTDSESLRIHADRVQIAQVLVNLLRNAYDAMRDIHTAHRITTVRLASTDDEVQVAVQDNGVGLVGVPTEKLFDAFFTTKKQGMGMGLTINRTIMEAHGGRIWATPGDEAGATFTLALPRYKESELPAENSASAA